MSILSLTRHGRGLGLSPRRRKAPGAALPTVIQDGLVAEWRFDEGAGQQLTDYSGNGHHGTLGLLPISETNEPTWTVRGLSFVGNNDADSRVTCPDDLITGGDPRTLCMVVKPGSTNRFGVEFNGDPVGTSFERWAVRSSGTPGFVRLEIQGAGQDSSLATSANTWAFIAVTQSGANMNTAIAYRDGETFSFTSSGVCATDGAFIMGQAGAGVEVEMELAYLMLYDRALSAEEIAQNRTALAAIVAGRGITLP